ncbi:MAG TPA: DUF58 domain-containing protein [Kofleriaceae bacterium]|nr:DUF58 domain-containing protein [Kofleriaceae bacterium]
MTPLLATRGKLVLGSAIMFIVVGSIYTAAPIVALGGTVLTVLTAAYLWFFPTAILLRRRKIELSWWVPPGDQPGGALSVERPFDLHVALRNHGARPLRVLSVGIHGTAALELPQHLEALVPAGRQVELMAETRAHSAGYQVIHGAVLHFGDILGLFEVRAYFPNPVALKVFPRTMGLHSFAPLRPRDGALHERVGLHQVRRRGLAGELREIREHSHGDPFKFIAWKATARKRKLMVRELESEIVVTHQILLDMAGSMRSGAPGRTKLDYAMDTAAALARTALDSGDRVGMLTFDSRVYSELRPGAGHHHFLKLIDRLVEVHNIVDEDLTDLTNGELVAAVARYLAHQEAVDVRLRRAPPLDSPIWERIQAGPTGELYDIGVTNTVVGTLLKSMGQAAAHKAMAPAWWWSRVHVTSDSDPRMAKLRLFCRLRGIELPYRLRSDLGRRAEGLAQTVDRMTAEGRADVIILISDLHGVLERPEVALKSLARARRRGQRLVVVAPFGPAFAPPPNTLPGQLVAEVLGRDEREIFETASKLVMRQGIPVIEAGPHDSAAVLLRRIAQSRGVRRAA